MALQTATSDDGVENTIKRETTLRHMAEFFLERRQYGALEHMYPDQPAFLRGYAEPQFDPKGWGRQGIANDLELVTGMIKRKPLSIENIEDFGIWK